MIRALALVAVLMIGRGPPTAQNEPHVSPSIEVAFAWQAPPSCPTAAHVVTDIEALGGVTLAVSASAAIHIVGRIDAHKDGYTLDLELPRGDAVEHRSLEAPSCELLARAAALVVALTLAPLTSARHTLTLQSSDAGAQSSISAPPPETLSLPTREDPDEEPVPTPSDDMPTTPLSLREHALVFGVSAGASARLLPGPSGVVAGELAWRWRDVDLGVRGFVASPAEQQTRSVSVRAGLAAAGLQVRYAPRFGPLEMDFRGGPLLGALWGQVRGAQVRATPTRDLWVAAMAEVGLSWPAQGLVALRVGLSAILVLRRPGIHLRQGAQNAVLFRAPRGGIRILAGPQLRFSLQRDEN